MSRKSLSLVATLFVTLLLLGTQRSSQAQTVGANCIVGSGSSAVQVRANGQLVNGTPSGMVYYRQTNGSNFTGSFRSLTFSTLSNGAQMTVGTSMGYLYNGGVQAGKVSVTATFIYYPSTNTGTIEIVTTGILGTVYFHDTSALWVSSGSLLITP